MDESTPTTRQKALAINLDATTYGTFAEIGGGQEVARWFFSVGGAARTVAKTISAYDMAVSDSLYGPAKRYVSRQRLEAMLEHEFSLVARWARARARRLEALLRFCANTVATRSCGHPATDAAGSASNSNPGRRKRRRTSSFTRTCSESTGRAAAGGAGRALEST